MNPEQIVREYLSATQSRDLVTANNYLADNFVMIFPGGAEFRSLHELVEWSRSRYQNIDKEYERFDVVVNDDEAVVYCFGFLFGQWLDGTSFSGIRFIDRFTVVDDKLVDQRVWNDLAETRRTTSS